MFPYHVKGTTGPSKKIVLGSGPAHEPPPNLIFRQEESEFIQHMD